MGKPFLSSQADLARDQRSSTGILGETWSAKALFSKTPGSAWNEALRAAELLLQDSAPVARLGNREHAQTQAPNRADVCMQALVAELEAAEREANETSEREWNSDLKGAHRSGEIGVLQEKDDFGRVSEPVHSDWQGLTVSHGVLSERATQWGYEVLLKGSSKESTPRTSSASSSVRSSSGGFSQAIPGVSKRVRDALSSFQLAFLVCDASHHDYPILYASAGFATMTGYSMDEVVGRNCRCLQGANTDKEEVSRIKDALSNGRIYTGTVLNYKKDGTPFWNLLTLSPIKDDKGNIIKYIGMQAEQKYQQPKNVEGQTKVNVKKTPSRALPREDGENTNLKLVGVVDKRRDQPPASNQPAKPPVPPQKASANRQSIEAFDQQPQPSRSNRYSLTMSSARNSFDDRDPDWRMGCRLTAATGDEVGSRSSRRFVISETNAGTESERAEAGEGSRPSPSFVSADTSARLSASMPTTNSSRRKSKILRLFRRESEDRKSQGAVSSRRDEPWPELSDSEDESEASGGVARPRRNASSMNLRPESMDINCRRPKEPIALVAGGNKVQFCIVET